MDDISIKILDALFDLCDGENYVILDVQDLTCRLPDYTFQPDELDEILETLSAEELVDLKYSDENEICLAMKMKGRSLIKQLRDRLQKVASSVEGSYSSSETQDATVVEADTVSAGESVHAEIPIRLHREPSFGYEKRPRPSDAPRPPRPSDKSEEEEEKKMPAEKKLLLFSFLGAAAGAAIINLIWLILFFVLR